MVGLSVPAAVVPKVQRQAATHDVGPLCAACVVAVGRTLLSLGILAGLVGIMGCATSPASAPADTASGDPITACEAPRPEACAMHYDPVCGVLKSGVKRTYSNGCVACSDHEVTGYRAGACPAEVRGDASRGQ